MTCGDCEHPLTASWSKRRTGKLHPYYLCHNKWCDCYGKSIRKANIEKEFAQLIRTLRPSAQMFKVVKAMVEEAWNQRSAQSKEMALALKRQMKSIDTQIEKIIDLLTEASSPTSAKAYERKIDRLERERILISEKLQILGNLKPDTNRVLEPCMRFLANPWKLWESGNPSLQKLLLRLTFSEPLAYSRNEGFRTAKTTLPFNMLAGICTPNMQVAPGGGFEPPTRGFSVFLA